MGYHQTFWPVAPELAPLVDHIWVMRCDDDRLEAAAGALLPQLIWQLSGRLAWIAPHSSEAACFPATLLGPSAGALRLVSEGNNLAIGVGVFPEGWHAFIETDASALVGKLIDLGSLWGDDALTPLIAQTGGSDRELANRVHALLLQRLQNAPPLDPRVPTISRWINEPTQDIKYLAQELGVSDRQLSRIARRAHGLPPRVLANKHRVLKTAAMIASGAIDVRDAWAEEFSDQSHFIREFRRFMGITPAAFLQDGGWLVREVMRVRQDIASQHPLGLA